MNKVILMGRLTRDPEVRYSQKQGENMCVARYTLAVDRKVKDAGTDFISCVAFGKNGEFAEKYFKKGTKIVLEGHIQTGSYTNKDGQKIYTTDVAVEHSEFAESKGSSQDREAADAAALANAGYGGYGGEVAPADEEGFVNIPDGIDEELPFG